MGEMHAMPGGSGGPARPEPSQPGLSGAAPARARRGVWWHPGSLVALLRGRAVLAAFVLLTLLFSTLTVLVIQADLRPTPWDIYITHELQELPEPVGVVLEWVSLPGFSPWVYLMVAGILAVLLAGRWFTEAAFTALAAAGGFTSDIVKDLIDRPRPTPDLARIAGELHSYSFPSGHVTEYTALFGFLFYLAYTSMARTSPLRWAMMALTALLIVLVGPSRVYMGQHWASDALAGYALGFAYLLGVVQLHRLWLRRRISTALSARRDSG